MGDPRTVEVSERFKDHDGMPLCNDGFYVARDGVVYKIKFPERGENYTAVGMGGKVAIRDADAFAGDLRRISNPRHAAEFMLRD